MDISTSDLSSFYLNGVNLVGTISSSTTNSGTASSNFSWNYTSPSGTVVKFEQKKGMSPEIFFKLMKKKMGLIPGVKYKKRINKLEKIFNSACSTGQIAFGEEILNKIVVLTREAEMWANGFDIYINRAIYNAFRGKCKKPCT